MFFLNEWIKCILDIQLAFYPFVRKVTALSVLMSQQLYLLPCYAVLGTQYIFFAILYTLFLYSFNEFI